MNSSPDHPDDSLTEEEQQLFGQLHQYLEAIQEGDMHSSRIFWNDHPHLKELFHCINDLESLSPVATGDSLSPASGSAEDEITTASGKPAVTDLNLSSWDNSMRMGNYELLNEIGRGGMGVVYQARQADLDRMVAVKMIRSSCLASQEDVQRFHQEARAAAGLQHPHIVKIFEVGQVGGQPFFSMEFIEGESLFQRLKRGELPVKQAVEIVAKVARAVKHLHQHHILHRDLKPQNILLDQEGQPFVTDFGLAKILEEDSDLTQTGAVLGTPGYMAPEQAAPSTGTCSEASDVYSLGAILYHALTGRAPFSGPNPFETLVAVLESEPLLPRKLNPKIPRELELICLKCLEKDPAKRIGSAQALADELERFLRGEPVETKTSEFRQRLRRWSRREFSLVTRLAAIVSAMVIIQSNYLVNGADQTLHRNVMSIFGCWLLTSFAFQWLVNRNKLSTFTRYGWLTADVLFLTSEFLLVSDSLGPLPAAYILIVIASGLFLRLSMVVYTTALTMIAYGLVWWNQIGLENEPIYYLFIFEALLVIIGVLTAFQVRRMNILSQYFQRDSHSEKMSL